MAQDLADEGLDRLLHDLRLRLAFERALYLVGEAAAALTDGARKAIDQPWREIINLRNVLAHQYEDLDLAILHRVAAHGLPPLVAAVEVHLR